MKPLTDSWIATNIAGLLWWLKYNGRVCTLPLYLVWLDWQRHIFRFFVIIWLFLNKHHQPVELQTARRWNEFKWKKKMFLPAPCIVILYQVGQILSWFMYCCVYQNTKIKSIIVIVWQFASTTIKYCITQFEILTRQKKSWKTWKYDFASPASDRGTLSIGNDSLQQNIVKRTNTNKSSKAAEYVG